MVVEAQRALDKMGNRAKVDDQGDRKRKRQERALDDALENTFPASDPVSIEEPTAPAADCDRSDA